MLGAVQALPLRGLTAAILFLPGVLFDFPARQYASKPAFRCLLLARTPSHRGDGMKGRRDGLGRRLAWLLPCRMFVLALAGSNAPTGWQGHVPQYGARYAA